MNEQIKSEIAKQVQTELADLKKGIELFSLPFKSEYKVLVFLGSFDGTALTPLFDLALIQNRILIIKSIKYVPYADADYIDIAFSDGTTETIPNGARMERIFDSWDQGNWARIIINGTPVIFGDDSRVTADYFIDNIFYKFPERIQTLEVSMEALIVEDLSAAIFGNPNGKCFIECYLI